MLSVIHNSASLIAQNSLNQTSNMLSQSLQRLSTGLKINSGADGPAGLVISEQQKSQIAGLQTAINNTSKAVSMVQTGEGALNEINALLTKIRSLALDSANAGYNNTTALAANQAEISNAINTITSIAKNTQFNTKNLLDGSRALSATDSVGTNTATATGSVATGSYVVTISQQATRANVAGQSLTNATDLTGGGTVTSETLTINGVGISFALAAGNANTSITNAANAINNVATQTGVRAIIDTSTAGSTALRLYSTAWGAGHQITVSSNNAAANSVLGTVVTNVDGKDVAGNISGVSGTGVGNVLTFNSGSAAGLTVTNGPTASGDTYTNPTTNSFTASNAADTVSVNASKALVFQIGANAGQTAQVSLDNVQASALGLGVSSSVTSLANIDVTKLGTNSSLSSDIVNVIDAAVSQVSNLRGTLGAFQANTLQSTANNLQASLQNTTSAESVVRDTDYAVEISNYTKLQVQLQAGQTVLSNANQVPQLITALLRG